MKIYTREGKHLVIIGDIPQWFIVDDFGLDVAVAISDGLTLEDILTRHPDVALLELEEVYDELQPLIARTVDRSEATVENSLTSKTTVAMISVTRRCNLQAVCPHCYVDAGKSLVPELSVAEHQNLADQVVSCLTPDPRKTYKINLTGGEPFVKKEIVDIIRAYDHVGLGVNMSTNGMLIKDSDIATLSRLSVVLSISLDGAQPETHDYVRGSGSWHKVIAKIRKLTDVGVKVGINCLLHEGNFAEFERMITLAHELGCSGFNPINLAQLGRARGSNLKRVSEVEIFKRLARHLASHPEEKHLFAVSSLFSSMGAALLTGITCESCGVGNRPCVYIDETGSVYPCPNTQLPEFLLGNIREQPLADCTRLDHPVLERLRELHVDALNVHCASCDVRYFCGGDCRGETYCVTGDIKAPYVACEDRHDSVVEMMWVAAEQPDLFTARSQEYLSNLR